jgi:hypothetical protein
LDFISMPLPEFSYRAGVCRAGRFSKLLPFCDHNPLKPAKNKATVEKFGGRIALIGLAVSFSREIVSGN